MIEPGVYKHFKGGYVLVMCEAKHSDRDENVVVYLGLNNGKYYARPVESFMEMVENSEGKIVSRFVHASKEEAAELMPDKIYSAFCDELPIEQEKI